MRHNGRDRYRVAVARLRVLIAAERFEQDAEIVVPVDRIGLERDPASVTFLGLLVAAELREDEADVVGRVRLVWFALE